MAAKRNPMNYAEAAKDVAAELAVLNATLTARLDSIDEKIAHQSALIDERLRPIADHESRIRALEEAIGALKVKYDWLTGGSLAASVASLLKGLLGL
ncbi:MAG: hypothetical protein IJI07_00600 [Flexilinea sp.]|nr:hypothetical protein [Flexilinea sp.]